MPEHKCKQHNSATRQSNCEIEVFDFRANWHTVKPYLKHPKIRAGIERAVNHYLRDQNAECIRNGWKPGFAERYDPKRGPWFYTRSDYWYTRADDLASEAFDCSEVDSAWELIEFATRAEALPPSA